MYSAAENARKSTEENIGVFVRILNRIKAFSVLWMMRQAKDEESDCINICSSKKSRGGNCVDLMEKKIDRKLVYWAFSSKISFYCSQMKAEEKFWLKALELEFERETIQCFSLNLI